MGTVFFDGSTSASGLELMVQGGVDLSPAPGIGIGPIAALSVGWFGSCSAELNDTQQDCEVESTRAHSWLVLGVRNAFDL